MPSLRVAASLLAAAALLLAPVSADDYLVSRRHQKRVVNDDGNFNISIYHINDVHAHLDEFASAGTDCVNATKGCYGGYARVKHVIDQTRPSNPDSLFLNIGDEFQGTLFYTYYKGEKIAETINQLGFDAMTLGNHEFDGGDELLGGFLKNLTFPIVCANIQTNNTALNSTIKPYHVFEKHQLAVIGVTTETIPDISSPGPSTTFQDPVTVVQATVDHIKATEKNVTRIIAMTHIGYEKDIELAKKTRGVHLIVGGHSHTLLGSMEGAEGPYPTIEKNLDGDEVFVVTSFRWGEYVGHIDVAFDSAGKIVAYTGAPVHLTNQTEQDAGLQKQIKEWRGPFEKFAAEVVGDSEVELDQTKCKSAECLLGDVMTDAIVDYRSGEADGAIINGGGVRATIDVGDITRGEVITAFPFGNAVVDLKFTGEQLWKIFEGVVSQHSQFNDRPVVPFIQVSKEIRFEYNPSLNNGSRMISLQIGGKAVDFAHEYRIASIDFLANGGDNQLPEIDPSKIVILDALDEVLLRYLNKTSPVKASLDGRIKATNATSNSSGSNNDSTSGNGNGITEAWGINRGLVAAIASGILATMLL